MLNDLDIMPHDPAGRRAVNRLRADEVKVLSLKVEQLQHQLHGHNRHRFGSKSENLDQLNLTFEEDEEITEAAEEQAKPAQSPTEDKPPRQHNRKLLPDHLDRHDEVLSPCEDCARCDGKLKTLGEDVTEELKYVLGRFIVNRTIRPRKAYAGCEAIVQWQLPSRPFKRGRPGPGLLAHVLVRKYAHHLPQPPVQRPTLLCAFGSQKKRWPSVHLCLAISVLPKTSCKINVHHSISAAFPFEKCLPHQLGVGQNIPP